MLQSASSFKLIQVSARAEAGGAHLLLNPLPGITHQDSHQQIFFDVLLGMDKGVLPFTMRAAMTMFVSFEESIGCKGVEWPRQTRIKKKTVRKSRLTVPLKRILKSHLTPRSMLLRGT